MGRRRIEMYKYREVIARLRAGDADREIGRLGLLGREKVAVLRVVAKTQGWLQSEVPLPDEAQIAALVAQHKRSPSTVSRAEPWRELLTDWQGRGVAGNVMHAALCRDHGFTGSYSSVARMLQGIRAALPPDLTMRLHFAPAEAAQVDFGAGPMLMHPEGQVRRTWAFVMTLCFSRHQYVEFVWDQSVPTWLGCHARAFNWFGGVPGRIILDNAKCAIVKASINDPTVQRAYGQCATGYGFKIDPCPPHDPQKKGIVEAGVKYVKRNFLALGEWRSLSDLNEQARHWVMNTAGVRVHGTTRQAPLDLFKMELALLQALPDIAPDISTWHQLKVHRDCHIQFDKAYYSAPFTLVGRRLWVQVSDNALAIYDQYQHVHTHPRALKPGMRTSTKDHLPPNAQAFLSHDRRWCLEQASGIGPATAAFIERLLSDQILERLRAAQNVLRLTNIYGPERLEAACARALAHGSMHYGTVKSILKGGYDRLPLAPANEPAYADSAKFARNAQTLFNPVLH